VRPFRYERATDAATAVATAAASKERVFLAGGTNLVDLMKLEVATPAWVIDIRGVTSDRVEKLPEGGLRIGAAVRNSQLAADTTVRRRYPVLAQALLSGASAQLRNQATAGGNLLQRTRCVYFQDLTTPCNKREPGSGCSAVGGFGRDAAILGASDSCVATHPSDMAVALAALGAVVGTKTPTGRRSVPLTDLHRLPGDNPRSDTVLEHGELITHVDLPPLAFAANSRYWKVRDRASYAFALVSVAAALDVAGGVVRDVRLALGGVAHKPWRATVAERTLRGAAATEESFRGAAQAELAEARPLNDNAFKVPLAINMITRILTDLAGSRR
jgi:xanthine dehydrogenase YagS FAD-binding subunit